MCRTKKCANLENRVSYDRLQKIRETDRYRYSNEHANDFKRIFGHWPSWYDDKQGVKKV